MSLFFKKALYQNEFAIHGSHAEGYLYKVQGELTKLLTESFACIQSVTDGAFSHQKSTKGAQKRHKLHTLGLYSLTYLIHRRRRANDISLFRPWPSSWLPWGCQVESASQQG